jgi:hypothetical protein
LSACLANMRPSVQAPVPQKKKKSPVLRTTFHFRVLRLDQINVGEQKR